MIYLDNAATSWPKPEAVYEAVDGFLRQYGANPGRAGHKMSLQAGRVILETRELLASLFNIPDSSRLVFTANVTESTNLAIKGMLDPGDHVVLTGMEHNAVCRPIWALERLGVEHTVVGCSPEGYLEPSELAAAIRPNTRLVCVNHASNVVGTIQPIEKIGKLVSGRGAAFMVDCAQTAGVLPIDVQRFRIDLLAFTGHKGLMGPPGTGGLYIREGIEIRPLKEGGTGTNSELLTQPAAMPERYESGTLNTSGIAGLGAGVRFVMREGLDRIREHEQRLTARLLEGLRAIKGVKLYGPTDERQRVAVVLFNLEGHEANQVSFILDQVYDIATRSGLHCAPLAHRTIGTIDIGGVRVSPGYFTTMEQIEEFLAAVAVIAAE
ncbi:MAG: aminotransferase class V-fold PLP-dependent enzyme [Firmicutes bacterium]|nr:aminotransferase class V-fold PLP-dependent enzyme [Bacillota bacterium]